MLITLIVLSALIWINVGYAVGKQASQHKWETSRKCAWCGEYFTRDRCLFRGVVSGVFWPLYFMILGVWKAAPAIGLGIAKAATVLALAAIWPVRVLPKRLEKRREDKKARLLQVAAEIKALQAAGAAKALPPAELDPAVAGARRLVRLREYKAELEAELLKVGKEIGQKEADPEIKKIIVFPKRF